MKIKNLILSSVAGAALLTQSVQAIITGGLVTDINGTFIELTVPWGNLSTPDNTVGNNNFDDVNLYAFNEDQNVAVAPAGITPEIGAPLTGGTIVASHYIVFDPPTPPVGSSGAQTGWVEFDANILAVITSTAGMNGTDYLNAAAAGVIYDNTANERGLEGNDTVAIDGTFLNRLNINLAAGSPGDSVRVLTARSPGGTPISGVPDAGATALLLGIGLSVLAFARRRLS